MTGVNGRPEVILEYAEDVAGPWKEYQFLYKPGNISAAPVFIGTNIINYCLFYVEAFV
jgi:hypothetical protein